MLQKILVALLFAAPLPDFHLRDTLGAVHTRGEWNGSKAVLLFFVITDCPVGNSYVPEMNRIHQRYSCTRGPGLRGNALIQAWPLPRSRSMRRSIATHSLVLSRPRTGLVRTQRRDRNPAGRRALADGKLLSGPDR